MVFLSRSLSIFASISAFIVLIQTMLNQFLPRRLQQHASNLIRHCFSKQPDNATLVFDERDGMCCYNELYSSAKTYLCTKTTPSRLNIGKIYKEPNLIINFERTQTIPDTFEGIELEWRFVQEENKQKRRFELCLNKKHRNRALDRYVPFVLETARAVEAGNRAIKLHTLAVEGSRGSMRLDHPSTFDTLVMDPELKRSIVEDLDRFLRRREFYRRVGRAWKRGYLIYGPPGTGKSSLIAAMANHLRFDVYDLVLATVRKDQDLRKMFLTTPNRSILVIEDIDCSLQLPVRKAKGRMMNRVASSSQCDRQFTLSGLLNFIDGLWSCCGDERIIVFTTNHKDKLDPALLRPGRMDMHIHMSYLTPQTFDILASNYLNIRTRHSLFDEIKELIDAVNVTPAEVAEELMKSDDCDECLGGLVEFLKCKKMDNERKCKILSE